MRVQRNRDTTDKILVMFWADGSAADVLGWVDGNAIVYHKLSKREARWYTDHEVVNSKGQIVPVEVIGA